MKLIKVFTSQFRDISHALLPSTRSGSVLACHLRLASLNVSRATRIVERLDIHSSGQHKINARLGEHAVDIEVYATAQWDVGICVVHLEGGEESDVKIGSREYVVQRHQIVVQQLHSMLQ